MKKGLNLSGRHWSIVVISLFLFMLTNACTSDGENVILPKLAAANNWDYAKMLTIATAAGVISVLGNLVWGRICEKKGAKFTIVAALFTSAFFVFMYGASTTYWLYAIGLFGAICCGQSIAFFGANALIANWFSKKKGTVMGIVSVGPPLATIIMASVLTFVINGVGLRNGVLIVSLVLLATGIICLFVLKDTPESCGETVDNMPAEEQAKFEAAEQNVEKMPLSKLSKLKAFWYIIIIIGTLSLCQTGLMAQFIVRYTNSGFSENSAILMMSICAVIGIFGSMLVGSTESKLGTKKAYAIFAGLFALAFIINFTNIKALMYISIPMFGIVITLLQIFLSAYEISVFGRTNFKQANAIIFPVISMIGQLTFVLISICLKLFGEIRYAYLVFAVLLIISQIFNYLMPLKEN